MYYSYTTGIFFAFKDEYFASQIKKYSLEQISFKRHRMVVSEKVCKPFFLIFVFRNIKIKK